MIEFRIGNRKGFIIEKACENEKREIAYFEIFEQDGYVGSMLFGGCQEGSLSKQERAIIVSTLKVPEPVPLSQGRSQ